MLRLLRRRKDQRVDDVAVACDQASHDPAEAAPSDAVCTITVTVPQRKGLGSKLAALHGRLAVRSAAAGPALTLHDVPSPAIEEIWQLLGNTDRQNLRLCCRSLFQDAVRRVVLQPSDLPAAAQLFSRLPALSEIVLQLPHCPADGTSLADLELMQLQAWARALAGNLCCLHTLEVEGRLRGGALTALARLAASTPSLQRLRLPGLRLSGAARRVSGEGSGHSSRDKDSEKGSGSSKEERYLCGMLEALPGLVDLELGWRVGTTGSGSAAPLPPSVLRRVARLQRLQVLCADASAPRAAHAAAALLEGLPLLRRLSLRVSAADGSGSAALAVALCRLARLEHLELESADLGVGFGEALQLGRLRQLQSLALGLCPGLSAAVVRQVGGWKWVGWGRCVV